MQSENNVQLNLDISEVKGHLNSIENPLEKIVKSWDWRDLSPIQILP